MDNKRTKRGGGAVVALVLVVVLVLLPMLYVLSIGPAVWLAEHGLLNKPAAAAFYWPVEWSGFNVPVVGPVVYRYEKWWSTLDQESFTLPPLSAATPPPAATAPAPAAPPATPPAAASP